MRSKWKSRWSWLLGGATVAIAIMVVWGNLGSAREALDAYRTARQFMESIRVKDHKRFCEVMSDSERPRCTGLVGFWFENSDLPEVNTYSLRGIRHWGDVESGLSTTYTVKFVISPGRTGHGDRISLDLMKVGGRFVLQNIDPPGI